LIFSGTLPDVQPQPGIQYCCPTDDLASMYAPHANLGSHLFMTIEENVGKIWQSITGDLKGIQSKQMICGSDLVWREITSVVWESKVDIVVANCFGKIAAGRFFFFLFT